MAIIDYQAKENYYTFLVGRPHAWQLRIPISTSIEIGDTIRVVEVGSSGVPTGQTMNGTVQILRTNDFWSYNDKSRLVYIIPD